MVKIADPRNATVVIPVRLKPAAVGVLKRRADKEGRSFNEYMRFQLEDLAFRDRNKPRTERRRSKLRAKEVTVI